MTLSELRAHLQKRDNLRAQMGLPKDDIVQLEFIKDKAPSGTFRIRTQFGYGWMVTGKKGDDGKWYIVANVKRKNVEKVLRKAGV